jgi:hypothetical protein
LDRPLDISLIARKGIAEQPNRLIAQALKDLYDNLPRQIEN